MSKASKRLQTELRNIKKKPLEGVDASPSKDGDLMRWDAFIDGPSGTPFEGGKFKLEITFTDDYPIVPPNVKFKTPSIYHPNIDPHGGICISILKNEHWSPACTIQQLLLSISSLMAEPNASDPLNGSAGRDYSGNREKYDEIVKENTKKHAMGNNDEQEKEEI